MTFSLEAYGRRLLRRLSARQVYAAVEMALVLMLAFFAARLVWTVLTPIAPVGKWQGGEVAAVRPAADITLLRSFDAFFRADGQAGPVVASSLNLKLFGIRLDQVSGRGSAIIGTPDGQQGSYVVGDEIISGVTLSGVAFDAVTLSRDGVSEQLFLDQSYAAAPVAPSAPAPQSAEAAVDTARISSAVAFSPRLDGRNVSGVLLQPKGDGALFRRLGLQPGDVLVSVNGTAIRSAEQVGGLAQMLEASSKASLQVERGGRLVNLSVAVDN